MRRTARRPLASLAPVGSVVALAMLAIPAARAQDAASAPGASEAAPGEVTAPPGPSEAELADAHHSFEVATTAYTGGDYETAAEEFRAAYETTRHPELLFNVYLSEERAGRPAEAADALGRYLELATAIAAEERPLLERRLERLRARAEARSTSPPPAEELDDSALLASPMDAPATSSGGGGAPAEGGTSGPRAPEPTGGSPPVAGIALLVTAGVLLAGFAVLAPLSEVEDQRLASSCGRDAGRTCASGDTGALMALNLAADVSWIAATAAGVTGLVLMLALPPEGGTASGSEAHVAVVPWALPGGAGLAAGGAF